jgi:phosphohistidine phosphatase
MLVGHNPTLEDTVAALCAVDGNDWAIKIPTAGLVCLSFDVETWANLEPGRGVLQWFVVPKLVKAIQKDMGK